MCISCTHRALPNCCESKATVQSQYTLLNMPFSPCQIASAPWSCFRYEVLLKCSKNSLSSYWNEWKNGTQRLILTWYVMSIIIVTGLTICNRLHKQFAHWSEWYRKSIASNPCLSSCKTQAEMTFVIGLRTESIVLSLYVWICVIGEVGWQVTSGWSFIRQLLQWCTVQ